MEGNSLNNGSSGSPAVHLSAQTLCSEDVLESLSRYNMNHSERGLALIFNHENFRDKKLMRRDEATIDGPAISETLKNLDFDVRNCKDLRWQEIQEKLSEVAREDHKHRDCLLVVIMTYDEGDGCLHAFDRTYKEERIWSYFVTEKVKSLGGKPKIFLFQTSAVRRVEDGNKLIDSFDSPNSRTLIIPSHADFLKVYSSSKGQNSSSDQNSDSSFLLYLCQELKEYASKADLISILTKTINGVKAKFSSDSTNSNTERAKEIPIVTSTLTRRLFLKPKSCIPSGL